LGFPWVKNPNRAESAQFQSIRYAALLSGDLCQLQRNPESLPENRLYTYDGMCLNQRFSRSTYFCDRFCKCEFLAGHPIHAFYEIGPLNFSGAWIRQAPDVKSERWAYTLGNLTEVLMVSQVELPVPPPHFCKEPESLLGTEIVKLLHNVIAMNGNELRLLANSWYPATRRAR